MKRRIASRISATVICANGRGVAKDENEAINWYRAAADQDLPVAQNELGWMHDQGKGVAQSDEKAFQWYLKAAQAGLTLAQHNVAVMYARGRGVAKNIDEAINWYRKSADAGNPRSQAALANLKNKSKMSKCQKWPPQAAMFDTLTFLICFFLY